MKKARAIKRYNYFTAYARCARVPGFMKGASYETISAFFGCFYARRQRMDPSSGLRR